MRGVHELWSRFGVDQAMAEVGETGRAGPKVAALFAACER